jgi:L-ornithine N5-monooxygenase
MKDLATLRNPNSPITFLSYLHSQNRLVSFINRGSTIPSRREFSDYLSWAAEYVQNNGIGVLYGHEVFRFRKCHPDLIEVSCRNVVTGNEKVIRASES